MSWPMEFQFTVISLSDIYADVALVLVSLLSTIFQCKDLNVSKTKKKKNKNHFFFRHLDSNSMRRKDPSQWPSRHLLVGQPAIFHAFLSSLDTLNYGKLTVCLIK